jgi:plasmid stability protein
MIQVRNVPESLHRELVRRAALRGQSLTAYVQAILEREVDRPSRAEIVRRAMALEPVKLDVPVADLIREDREARSG